MTVKAAFAARGSPVKFRQAAIAYLHVGILYEAAVFAMARAGIFPETRGPVWTWLLLGAFFALSIPYALWRWQRRWFALLVWAVHSMRLPGIIDRAFFHPADGAADLSPAFWWTALVVVVINLAFLARAGFDL